MKLLPLLAALAFIPGLCDKPQDPSAGVPPDVWNLRRAIEDEVTRVPEEPERVTSEQVYRVREAAEAVARWENIKDVDVAAEVLYLLPRSPHWDYQDTIRDLIVLLHSTKGGPALEAEATYEGLKLPTDMRKAVMGYQIRLHKELAPMTPAERVARVLKEAESGAFEKEKFGWKWGLNFQYATMVMVHDAAEAEAPLAKLAAAPGPLRDWALRTLVRLPAPQGIDALRQFYAAPSEGAPEPAIRAAAWRFYDALAEFPPGATVIVQVDGPPAPIDAVRVVDAKGWEAALREDPRPYVALRIGVTPEGAAVPSLTIQGDRAVCLVEELREKTFLRVELRLRLLAGVWCVSDWRELR